MDLKRKRTPGVVTCKFDRDIDQEKCEKFIKQWIGFAITVCNNRYKGSFVVDRDIIKSSAMEALVNAYYVLEEKFKKEIWGQGLQRKVIAIECRQCLYHQLVYFGVFKDKKRVYFPTEWVSWEDFFKDTAKKEENFMRSDLYRILCSGILSENESLFIKLLSEGKEPVEIAKITGYGTRWVHQTIERAKLKISEL